MTEEVNKCKERIEQLERENKELQCCGNCKNVGDIGVIGCFCYVRNEYIYPHSSCDKWAKGVVEDVRNKLFY